MINLDYQFSTIHHRVSLPKNDLNLINLLVTLDPSIRDESRCTQSWPTFNLGALNLNHHQASFPKTDLIIRYLMLIGNCNFEPSIRGDAPNLGQLSSFSFKGSTISTIKFRFDFPGLINWDNISIFYIMYRNQDSGIRITRIEYLHINMARLHCFILQ